jgi:hypothetical protein
MTNFVPSVETDLPALSPEALSTMVKRHAHDLRNTLNGMEAELMLLVESPEPAEKNAAIKRLRQEMKCADGLIRAFTAKFSAQPKTPMPASDLAAKWMSDARALLPDCPVTWELKLGQAQINVEAVLLRGVLSDLLLLSTRHCPREQLEARCLAVDGHVVFSISGPVAHVVNHRDPIEQSSWSSLGIFAIRGNAVLERVLSPDNARFSHRLTIPMLAT